ncbi:MAG: hypothetical protein D6703_05980 [Zetaproteobacteria bacterium]|nr:MAG: hypothetical protein D6703_05980 [Zetaproteobacteria bacterium]
MPSMPDKVCGKSPLRVDGFTMSVEVKETIKPQASRFPHHWCRAAFTNTGQVSQPCLAGQLAHQLRARRIFAGDVYNNPVDVS